MGLQEAIEVLATGLQVRRASRGGALTGHTSGAASDHVQANLMIVPRDLAYDFLLYCQRNPKPCPLLAVGDPGDPHLPSLGADIDVRTDAPRYRVWRRGELVDEPTDLVAVWRDDLVTFAIGCSFSFEQALIAASVPLRHIACGDNVAMFRTNIQTERAGVFHGPMVVTMRPLSPFNAVRAVQITSRFPNVHGAPVHIGDPKAIGIVDLSRPDYGDPVDMHEGELPVFWACGVTPQAVVMAARPEFCITHAPGCMLVTDLKNEQLASF